MYAFGTPDIAHPRPVMNASAGNKPAGASRQPPFMYVLARSIRWRVCLAGSENPSALRGGLCGGTEWFGCSWAPSQVPGNLGYAGGGGCRWSRAWPTPSDASWADWAGFGLRLLTLSTLPRHMPRIAHWAGAAVAAGTGVGAGCTRPQAYPREYRGQTKPAR